MIENFNNIIESKKFLMYCKNIVGLNDLNLSLNLPIIIKGDIADYYLNISSKEKEITFEYILDLEIPKNKVYDFFILINRINEQSSDGYFSFNINQNIIKYHSSKNYFDNLTYENLLNLIDTNLELTSGLFHNFSLFVHNLAYGDINEQECIELMFLQIKGNA
jgi:hypothetical protein